MNKQLEDWLREILPYEKLEDFFQITEPSDEEGGVKVRFYTDDYKYAVTFHEKNNYMGCVAVARKSRTGEDWCRGNDLPDGPISVETWTKIKNAIIRYELKKLELSEPSVADIPAVAEVE